MEISLLLEPAIWKQSILRSFFDEMQKVHDYAALDEQFNKPQYLHEAMITSGASIIIPRVYDFLIGRKGPENLHQCGLWFESATKSKYSKLKSIEPNAIFNVVHKNLEGYSYTSIFEWIQFISPATLSLRASIAPAKLLH